jgi:hypothetical protein
MEKFEDILDKALCELKAGASKDTIFSKWPQHQQQLAEYLAVAEMFGPLPKNQIPVPTMQRKYLTMPIKSRAWFVWVHFSKYVSISMGALLLIAGFATTAYGAARSLPGASLFPLKKMAEQIQLDFASNDVQRANIQLQITKERLADAREVFSSPNSSSQQQAAALNELASQTGAAVQTVQSAAAVNQDKTPLVASLNNISNQQQALIKTITSNNGNIENSSATATPPQQAVATLIAATASEQKALIYLNQGNGSVQGAATGTPTSTAFSTTTTATSTTPSVSDSTTSTASSTPASPAGGLPLVNSPAAASTSTGTTSLPTEQAGTQDDNNVPLPAPSQAIGTFIPGDPRPQYVGPAN